MARKPSPDCEVFLGPTAFLSITVAAAEVYCRETVGILIGLRGGRKVWGIVQAGPRPVIRMPASFSL